MNSSLTQSDGQVPAAPDADALTFRGLRWYLPLIVLLLVSLGLAALSWITPSFGGGHPIYARDGEIGNFFNVDEESNLPTWWSTMLLGGGGVVYLTTAWVARVTRSGGAVAATLLGLLLLAMSMDEAAQLHETMAKLGDVVSSPFGNEYAWLLIGIPVALTVLVVALLAGLRLPRRTLLLLLLGFGVFFSGAVGLEALQAVGVDLSGEPLATIAYHVEETLEMTGASLVAVAPLAGIQLARGAGIATLRFRPRASRALGRAVEDAR